MINLKQSLALAILLAGAGSAGQAAVYTDVDLAGSAYFYLNANDSSTSNNVYRGTFNILQRGYNPQVEEVCDASFWFAFADDWQDGCGQEEWVKIKIFDQSGNLKSTTREVDGSIWCYDWIWGSIGGQLLATLSATGVLDYSVKILSGDTYLKEAGLCAETCARQVPDGGSTAALFGLGLLGLAAVRRHAARQ